MISKVEYNERCWWCSKIADSREHKYKKSDILREFGSCSFNNEVIRVKYSDTTEEAKEVQGAQSNQLKYRKVLCSDCNNKKSQPFDHSYDKLIDFLKVNEDVIYRCQSFDLKEIFGRNWKLEVENVLKYLVKHIGCRLAENNFEINQDMIEFLDGGARPKCLNLNLIIRTDKADFVQKMKNEGENNGYISITPLIGNYFSDSNQWEYLFGSYDYRGYGFTYKYCKAFTRFSCNLTKRKVKIDIYFNEEYEKIKTKYNQTTS